MTGERPAPSLVLTFPLEEAPRWNLVADTHEDEVRLRLWLSRSRSLESLEWWLRRLRDRLDDLEEAA